MMSLAYLNFHYRFLYVTVISLPLLLLKYTMGNVYIRMSCCNFTGHFLSAIRVHHT